MDQVQSFNRLKSNLILGMCLFYIINFFVDYETFVLFLSFFCLLVFLVCVGSAKSTPRYFSIAMLIIGIVLNFLKGDGLTGTMNGIITNLPLLTLVILVPLLSIPLKIGGYFKSIRYFMEQMKTDQRKVFGSISFFLFCLGPILNLGSIRLLHETIKDIKLPSIFIAKAYLTGFSTVILWSPYFASVALILFYLEVPVYEYIPLGFSLAIIQLITGNLLFSFWSKRNYLDISENKLMQYEARNKKIHGYHCKKMFILFIIIACLMCAIFLIEKITKWPMMFIVSIISILYPLLWCAFKKRWDEMGRMFLDFKKNSAPSMNNEIVLFISAGLFGKALQGTIFSSWIKQFIHSIASTSFMLFALVIIVIMVLFAFIGVHQIVVATALVTQIEPNEVGSSAAVIALVFMLSWSIGAVLSPINPLNLLVSGSTKQSGLSVGLKWNGVYLLIMFLIGYTFLYFVH